MKRKYNWFNHVFNFFAVILGVYLAFYISERAKINQDRNESLVLMNSLVADLSGDINTYTEYHIPVNKQHLQNVESLLNLLATDDWEGIELQLPNILNVENFSPTTSTYSSMKSAGKLGLIDDLALQKKLTGFYEGLVPESLRKAELQTEYFTNELLSWLTVNVNLSEMKLLNKNDLVVLSNKLFIYGAFIDQKTQSYEMIVEDSNKLKMSIESILESN